jgi:hypothetical protein
MRRALAKDPDARRSLLALAATIAIWAFASSPAIAASPCDGVERTLADAGRREYSKLVADAIGQKAKPETVKIVHFMASGPWSAVYASTGVSDDGVLFFDTVNGRKRFKDVWGGWATPDDRPELIRWATALGAPETLARCFAHVVID